VLIYVTEPMDRRNWIKDDAGDVLQNSSFEPLTFGPNITVIGGLHSYIRAPDAAIVNQGTIEKSNVNSVMEMTRMVEVTRTYTQIAQILQNQSDLRERHLVGAVLLRTAPPLFVGLLDRGPILLVVGVHPAPKQAGVDLRHQVVVVSPSFDPVCISVRPLDLAVDRSLHPGNQLPHGYLFSVQGIVCGDAIRPVAAPACRFVFG